MTDKLTTYDKLTDAKKAAIWQKGRDAGESVKTIRLTRTGHGPTAALREWHRLMDAGLLKDNGPQRGRPAKAAPAKTAAKKAPAKATAKKVVSSGKRQPAKRVAEAPKAETA